MCSFVSVILCLLYHNSGVGARGLTGRSHRAILNTYGKGERELDKEKILADLFEMQDIDYRDFQCRLMPTVPREHVIGVRTPLLRAYARSFDREKAEAFMAELPHRYYEENNFHAFLIERLGEWQTTVDALERFLPYVDNWATCDMMRPAVFADDPSAMRRQARIWMHSPHPYTVRFGIEMLMVHGLEQNFTPDDLDDVAAVPCEHPYLSRMVAWYFATALAFRWEETIPYLESDCLDVNTRGRAITKAIESHRLTPTQKEYLRTLRS